jgi:hypothetical protein
MFSTRERKKDSHITNPKGKEKVIGLIKDGKLERKHNIRTLNNVASNPLSSRYA